MISHRKMLNALSQIFILISFVGCSSIESSNENNDSANTNNSFSSVETSMSSKDSIKKTYRITWKNYDDTILEIDENVEHGVLPTFDSEIPMRPNGENSSYIFKEWSPKIVEATADATYIACYSEIDKRNRLIFQDEDGKILQDTYIKEGESVFYDGNYPNKKNDGNNYFVFSGWKNKNVDLIDTYIFEATYDTFDINNLSFGYGFNCYYVTGINGEYESVAMPNIYNDGIHGEFPVTALKIDFSNSLLKNLTLCENYNGQIFEKQFYQSSLENIGVVGSGKITRIGDSAFYGTNINNLSSFLKRTQNIGNKSFYGCTNLKRIDLSMCNELISIGDHCFGGLTSLEYVKLPLNINSFGEQVFSKSQGNIKYFSTPFVPITSIQYGLANFFTTKSKSNPFYNWYGDINDRKRCFNYYLMSYKTDYLIHVYKQEEFIDNLSIETLEITNMTEIYNTSLYGLDTLKVKKLIITGQTKKIGDLNLYSDHLESIELPESVKYIYGAKLTAKVLTVDENGLIYLPNINNNYAFLYSNSNCKISNEITKINDKCFSVISQSITFNALNIYLDFNNIKYVPEYSVYSHANTCQGNIILRKSIINMEARAIYTRFDLTSIYTDYSTFPSAINYDFCRWFDYDINQFVHDDEECAVIYYCNSWEYFDGIPTPIK